MPDYTPGSSHSNDYARAIDAKDLPRLIEILKSKSENERVFSLTHDDQLLRLALEQPEHLGKILELAPVPNLGEIIYKALNISTRFQAPLNQQSLKILLELVTRYKLLDFRTRMGTIDDALIGHVVKNHETLPLVLEHLPGDKKLAFLSSLDRFKQVLPSVTQKPELVEAILAQFPPSQHVQIIKQLFDVVKYTPEFAQSYRFLLNKLEGEQKINMVMTRDHAGKTLLHYASRRVESLQAIIEIIDKDNLFDVLCLPDNYGITPLHEAAANPDALQLALDGLLDDQKRIAVTLFDKNRRSLLHCASENPKSLEMLLATYDKGALFDTIFLPDVLGNTVFHSAARRPGCLKVIMDHLPGQQRLAALCRPDINGNTVLHFAADKPAYLKNILISLPLPERIEALNVRNKDNKTVLDLINKHPVLYQSITALMQERPSVSADMPASSSDQNIFENLAKIDENNLFRLIVDGKFHKKEIGWRGYASREPNCLGHVFQGFKMALANIQQRELSTHFIRNIHRELSKEIPMLQASHSDGNIRRAGPGEYRSYNTSFALIPNTATPKVAGNTTRKGLQQLFEKKQQQPFQSCEFIHFDRSKFKDSKTLGKHIEIHQSFQKNTDDADTIWANLEENSADPKVHWLPPAFGYVPELLEGIVTSYNEEIKRAQTSDEKLRVIVKHVQDIEQLHPFQDGNLRTCILLLQRLLIQNGFLPVMLEEPNIFDAYDLDTLIEEVKIGMQNTQTILDDPKAPLFGHVAVGLDDYELEFPGRHKYDLEQIQIFKHVIDQHGNKLDSSLEAQMPSPLDDKAPASPLNAGCSSSIPTDNIAQRAKDLVSKHYNIRSKPTWGIDESRYFSSNTLREPYKSRCARLHGVELKTRILEIVTEEILGGKSIKDAIRDCREAGAYSFLQTHQGYGYLLFQKTHSIKALTNIIHEISGPESRNLPKI
jgi:hypothetical protein